MSSDSVPGSMEVVGHHIDEVQFPVGNKTRESLFQKLWKIFCENSWHTHLAISAISYPASMVPFPADTAAVSISWGFPVALASAA